MSKLISKKEIFKIIAKSLGIPVKRHRLPELNKVRCIGVHDCGEKPTQLEKYSPTPNVIPRSN